MKLTKLTLVAVLALGGAAFFQSANADSVPFPTDGDLFMGFHSSSATNEYLVDIGQFSLFNNQPVGFHLALGNYGADLSSALGANWFSDLNAQWGVAGTLDATSQLFASKVEPSVGTFAQPWGRQSVSSQNFTGSQIDTMAFGDYAGQDSTANNPTGVIHGTGGLSWASYNNGANSPGGSFGTWVPSIEGPNVPGTGNGIPSTRLDLFRIDPDNTGTNPPSKYIGSFSIDSAGNVSYDVFAAVPEPSAYVSMVAGGALLAGLGIFRRRSVKA